ncbi:MAG: hypothetical protein QM534_09600 [Sediminibacterium sp.]|nr:hypothetical protein [Sediminibacterium sp.]
MKIKLLRFSSVLFMLLSTMFTVRAQCIQGECSKKLGDFTFIKSVNINSSCVEGKANQFSYVFSQGSTYMVLACDSEKKGARMIVNLYDKEKNLIATNKNRKKFYPSITFPCSATGVYYIESFYEGSSPDACGINVLGFSRTH